MGPYVSERQWGTVREDYSSDGEAWNYLPHDHARSRAYRWGEDGLAGFSDIEQRLWLGLALWNGQDPILKERIYALTGQEGNHGEDAEEYWWVHGRQTQSCLEPVALPEHVVLGDRCAEAGVDRDWPRYGCRPPPVPGRTGANRGPRARRQLPRTAILR